MNREKPITKHKETPRRSIFPSFFTPHTHDQGGLMSKYGQHFFENDLKNQSPNIKKELVVTFLF
jgi:hypothetical protein